jgi:hypothetical protein
MTPLHLEEQFPYRRADRPTVVVRLSYGDSQVDTEAMFDTGASVSIFDASLASLLDISLARARHIPVLGLDGKIRAAALVPLDLAVLPVSAGISSQQIPVAFLDGIERSVGNLLGRDGFFSSVDFALSHARRTIYLGLARA